MYNMKGTIIKNFISYHWVKLWLLMMKWLIFYV